jgi:signal transduction histidine kinase
MILLFRQDRASLISRQFSDTKITQLARCAPRSRAPKAPSGARRCAHRRRVRRAHRARVRAARARARGPAASPLVAELSTRLQGRARRRHRPSRAAAAPAVPRPARRRRHRVLGCVPDAGRAADDDAGSRALAWSLAIVALLLAAAFAFARYLARPLRQLNDAVDELGRGGTPSPLPETGPSEIAAVNRRFNAMLANLTQIERDRALLLAGVSHDLRTPLARLRLGVEMHGDAARPRGHGRRHRGDGPHRRQFLDFSRADDASGREPAELDPIVRQCVERYVAGRPRRRLPRGRRRAAAAQGDGDLALCANLVDNALAYGAPPVEVATIDGPSFATIEVRDRGAGIAPGDVERLKRPFTRASDARTRDDGAAGAGLGLAIVERVARLHGGTLELVGRAGGGTIARVTLARRPA